MASLPAGTVTFLYTDIEGSARLWEQHPVATRRAVDRHLTLLRDAVAAHGGQVFRTVGDGLCAAFATAPEAVAAALLAQRTLLVGNWGETGPLRVRMALHTGAVEVQDGDYVGACLNRLGRLLAAGHGGQILLSQVTAGLIRDAIPAGAHLVDLGEQRLRDLAATERAFQLAHPDLPANFPPLKSVAIAPSNLPLQVTSFVGREREVADVRELLSRTRLLTLTGPGGTGKTRLALEVTQRSGDHFPDGMWFVPLAPLTDPSLVTEAIAHALDVKEVAGMALLSSLTAFLHSKRLVLLLDNFEHVLDAAPVVGELLGAAPGLTVLTTSRAPLRLAGELEFAVPPLQLPGDRALLAAPLAQYDAVQLFIERAKAVKADFVVTNANAPAVAELCHRLDGLPLAIELAAARVRLLPPQALLDRLSGDAAPLHLLGAGPRNLPPRQQTLRNTIAWSYDLLSPAERRLFVRTGVFMNGATLDAIDAVANADGDLGPDVLEGVDALTTNSLLRVEAAPEGTPRFGMLVTVRDFAREQLIADGTWEDVRRRHAEYYLTLVEYLAPRLHGPARWNALAELDAEQDNVRAALGWAVGSATSALPAMRLAAGLVWFWYWRSQLSEGRGWLQAVLARAAPEPHTDLWAMLRFGFGALAWTQGDLRWGRSAVGESIELFRALDEQRQLSVALTVLGAVVTQQGDPVEGQRLCEEALAVCRALSDHWWEGATLAVLGDATLLAGEPDRARTAYEQGLALFDGIGDPWGLGLHHKALAGLAALRGDFRAARDLYERAVADLRAIRHVRTMAFALAGLGEAASQVGDLALADDSYREGLTHFRDLGHESGEPACLLGLADVAAAQGAYQRAARLLSASPGRFKMVGVGFRPMADGEFEEKVTSVRARMGEAAFNAAWASGRAMTREQAVAYALEEGDDG